MRSHVRALAPKLLAAALLMLCENVVRAPMTLVVTVLAMVLAMMGGRRCSCLRVRPQLMCDVLGAVVSGSDRG